MIVRDNLILALRGFDCLPACILCNILRVVLLEDKDVMSENQSWFVSKVGGVPQYIKNG